MFFLKAPDKEKRSTNQKNNRPMYLQQTSSYILNSVPVMSTEILMFYTSECGVPLAFSGNLN